MKKNILIIIILAVFPGLSPDPWNLEFTKDGVTVSTREVAGSQLKAFKAVGEIQAGIDKVNSVLCDNPGQVRWMPDCIVSIDLKKDVQNFSISYNETRAPVVNNRDVIVETRVSKEKNRIIHEFHAIDRPDLVPEFKGKVRIKDMDGRWELTQSGTGTHVVFIVRANPGGIIPAWLANISSKEIPYKTFIALRKMSEVK